ncbi:MAG: flavin prenyltransferase UbiX [Crocosphaera sp.]
MNSDVAIQSKGMSDYQVTKTFSNTSPNYLNSQTFSQPVRHPLILGVTGASGLIYAVRTVKWLLKLNYSVELVASRATAMVWQKEHNLKMPVVALEQEQFWRDLAEENQGNLTCHPFGNVGATIASGSFPTLGMLVIPCSMSTVAKIASGMSSDLLERAADVQIKEGRKLVVVPRETPLSVIHLRNLTTLAEAGVRVVPAIPAWYHQPQTIDDLVDFVVSRALDQFGIENSLIERWKGQNDLMITD